MSVSLPWHLYIFRAITEISAYILIAYAINRKKIVFKDFIISLISIAIIVTIVKQTVKSMGIPQFFFIVSIIFILTYINKLDLLKSVISVIATEIYLISLETLCFIALKDYNIYIISLPSQFIFFISAICFYKIRTKKNKEYYLREYHL